MDEPVYQVRFENGDSYGPVDFETLQAWVVERRIVPTTVVEQLDKGVTVEARFVPGLFVPAIFEPDERRLISDAGDPPDPSPNRVHLPFAIGCIVLFLAAAFLVECGYLATIWR